MERTKLPVEWRGTAWFVGNIELRFDKSYCARRRRHPGLDWETRSQLGLGGHCIYLRDCTTCRRKFLGAPTARYCSEECRHPAKLAAAARQQAQWAEMMKQYRARLRCGTCGEPIPDRKRLRGDPIRDGSSYCSNACRQKAYRRRKQDDST
jgi:hypothetical protein